MTGYEKFILEKYEVKTSKFNFFSEVYQFIYSGQVHRMVISVNLDENDMYSVDYYEYD